MTLLPATHHDLVSELVRRWRDDPGATYRSWFLWDERLKNFRSIRRGLQQVVAEIERGRFGVASRGSSLETVVHSIAEPRQIFKGADHARLWRSERHTSELQSLMRTSSDVISLNKTNSNTRRNKETPT